MKRFWREVNLDPDGGVALDDRPVRTPGREPLTLPTRALAQAVADEWRAVGETIDPRAMPLTGLANAAIDRVGPDRVAFAASLTAYAESDLLCYRADTPPELVARQRAGWDPLLDWARRRYDVAFVVVTGVMHRPQPAATLARLGAAITGLDPFTLAALYPVVTVTGSLVLALTLLEGEADPEAVWRAARIDEDWQAEMWGHDPLAAAAIEARRHDYDAGVRLLGLLASPLEKRQGSAFQQMPDEADQPGLP